MATNNFNPAAYGATPVTTPTAGAFDPTKYGATPVVQPSAPVPQPKKDLLSTASDVVNTVFPAKNIVSSLSTAYDNVKYLAQHPGDVKGYNEFAAQNRPNIAGEVGDIAQNALYFAPVGTAAKTATAVASKVLPRTVAKFAGNVAAGAGTGYGFDVAQGLSSGESPSEVFKPGAGTAIGAALPIGGAAIKGVKLAGEATAPRLINSLIKPLSKQFTYGKNPGRAVAELGIKGNSLDDLATNINATRLKIGEELGTTAQGVNARIDFSHTLEPFDDAIKQAIQNNDQQLLTRLTNARDAITHIFSATPEGKIAKVGTRLMDDLSYKEGVELKGRIGDLTKWTGQATEDNTVNGALTRVYAQIKKGLDTAAESVDPTTAARLRKFNEQYADLLSAESAAKYRIALHERQNLVNLPGKIGLTASLIAAPFTGGLTTIIGGLTSVALDKALSSPAVKTRLAAFLAKSTPKDLQLLQRANPSIYAKLKGAFSNLQFPGDTLVDQSSKGGGNNFLSAAKNNGLNASKAAQSTSAMTNISARPPISDIRSTIPQSSADAIEQKLATDNVKTASQLENDALEAAHGDPMNPKILSTDAEKALHDSMPDLSKIDERLAPLVDKEGMVTVYRAAPKFPDETFAKDTHFSTKPESARYYAESHYNGSPRDITIRSVKVPASKLKRGGSADSWQLTEDHPASSASVHKEGKASAGALIGGGAALGAAAGLNALDRKLSTQDFTNPTAGKTQTSTPEVVLPKPSAHIESEVKKAAAKANVSPSIIKTLAYMESSMATDTASRNPKIGKYAWVVGLTNIAKKDLKQAGINADFNTEAGALAAAGQFFQLLQKRYPKESPTEIYFNHYFGGKADPKRVAAFKQAIKEYANI